MSVELVVILDGKERPAWAIQAGDDLVATEYDHDRQRMTLSFESNEAVRLKAAAARLSTTP